MGNASAKSINLLLYEGNLNGVISIEDTSWNSGELYAAPRDSISDLLDRDACNKYGVYLLLSDDMVYVGQSSDLAKRITQHTTGKDWWDRVVILTTKDDSLNHSDIDFLESILIDKAAKANRLDCDNKNKGNPPKVDKFRKVYLGQYLDEALFLLQLIGITVFCNNINRPPVSPLIPPIGPNTKLAVGKGAKAEAISFLSAKGFQVGKNVSYAVRQESKDEFWINPNVKLLNTDWDIILNDNVRHELILLKVPAKTFSLSANSEHRLFVRKDNPIRIDLNINVYSLVDRKSHANLTPFVLQHISY